MTLILHKQLSQYLKKFEVDKYAQTYFIYGEKLLVDKTLKKLISVILPGSINSLSIETFDEDINSIIQAINSINTFSLSRNGKVIIIKNSTLFESKEKNVLTKKKIKKLYKNGRINEASKLLMELSSEFNSVYKGLDPHKLDKSLIEENEQFWLKKLTNFCNTSSATVDEKDKNYEIIQRAVETGFPEKHFLILLSNNIAKQNKLFKLIEYKGVIIDCFIPKNRTRSVKALQESVMRDMMKDFFDKNEKTISQNAYDFLSNVTGFELNTFSNNLNKLVDYVGKKKNISIEDVRSLLERTKKDFLFDFTNAMAEQNFQKSLFYLNSLLSDNVHPLQILSAIANNIRNLLLAKNFILQDNHKTWVFGQTFNQFKLSTLQAIKKYDENMENTIIKWNNILKSYSEKYDNSLFLLKNKNPYSTYTTILKSEKLSQSLLFDTILRIVDAEKNLKFSSSNPKNILTSIVLSMCKSSNNPEMVEIRAFKKGSNEQ